MAIIVDRDSKIIIQGITGTTGRTFAERMSKYYDTLVGGVMTEPVHNKSAAGL